MSFLWEGALPFIFVLGTVVVFHEFGHFLAAKAFGITVEVFSVGFGPRIAGFNFRGTEYRVAWIPLGGYVKLKGEIAPEDGHTPEPGELMAHPRWQRFIVYLAFSEDSHGGRVQVWVDAVTGELLHTSGKAAP